MGCEALHWGGWKGIRNDALNASTLHNIVDTLMQAKPSLSLLIMCGQMFRRQTGWMHYPLPQNPPTAVENRVTNGRSTAVQTIILFRFCTHHIIHPVPLTPAPVAGVFGVSMQVLGQLGLRLLPSAGTWLARSRERE